VKALLLDEMLSPKIAEPLRAAGADVTAISETPRLKGTADPDVLEFATSEKRVLVTANIRDFAPLDALWAAQGRTHDGILFISTSAYPQDRTWVGRVVGALQGRLAEDRWPAPGQVDFL
jgi:hypothetical protein